MSDVFLRTYGPNTWKSGHAQTTSNTPTPPGKWGYLRGFDPICQTQQLLSHGRQSAGQKRYLQILLHLGESANLRPVLVAFTVVRVLPLCLPRHSSCTRGFFRYGTSPWRGPCFIGEAESPV